MINRFVKISIIIPFYNVANYVARCMDSILSQDMPDFEVIAVNDGSTDTTSFLLEEYAAKDYRVKVLHLENGGQGLARNQGVKRAGGEYLMFVDGDDFILPGALSKLYNYAQANTADVVIFNYRKWVEGAFSHHYKFLYPKNIVMNALTAAKMMLLNKDPFIWNKFIKREFYIGNDISFGVGITGEDIPVSCKILIRAKRIFYIEDSLYAYVYRSTSIVHSSRTAKYIKDLINNVDIMREEIKNSEWKDELAAAFNYRYIRYLLRFIYGCLYEKYKSEEESLKVKDILKVRFRNLTFKQILFNSYLDLPQKRSAIVLKLDSYKNKRTLKHILKNESLRFWIEKVSNNNHYSITQKFFLKQQLRFEGIKTFLIWGTGNGGKHTYEWLESMDLKVAGFIDNDRSKWGKTFLNLPIYSPESIDKRSLKTNPPYIFIGTMYIKEVEEELVRLGYRNKWEFSVAAIISGA